MYYRLVVLLVFLLFPDISNADGSLGRIGIDIDSGNFTAKIFQTLAFITIISLAPSILVMVTSFTRIVVVLSFLRSAMGLQQTPPNGVIISLALFLSFYIMMPTFSESYKNGIMPLIEDQISEKDAISFIGKPFHKFMLDHTREKDISLFNTMSGKDNNNVTKDNIEYQVLIPAFMISELRRAFEIGFLLFIPFLIIDILVSSILMAMGMMMLPPVMISMPFKIIFFVLCDGWYMISGSLIRSYGL